MSTMEDDFRAPAPVAAGEPLATAPSFSIVITAYEAAATVADAVRSALTQTHPAHEVIVVDDGSSDDLDAALAQFGDRIGLVRKENGGGASARNVGVAAASGEFMAILDADDVYHPRRLEALAELARARPDLDLLTTDARFIVAGKETGRFAAANPFATEDQRQAIFAGCFVGGWPAVRLTSLRAIGGFDERMRIAYDWDCWLRLILAGAQAGLVERPYYDYVLHSGSLASGRVASLWERVRLLEKALENPDLRPTERGSLATDIRWRRSEALREEARATLAGEGSRRQLLGSALGPNFALRARAAALAAAAVPALARRRAEERRAPEERF
jgi:glycosyltransferase involved in cell wall biosynthesis